MNESAGKKKNLLVVIVFPLITALSGIAIAASGFIVDSRFVAEKLGYGPKLNPLDTFFVNFLDLILFSSGSILFLTGIYLFLSWKSHGGKAELFSGGAAEYTTALPATRALDLFLISFLMLFMELALIRWIPAYIRLLGYFSNFILLACFLGIGLGCIMSKHRSHLLSLTPVVIALIVAATIALYMTDVLDLLSFSAGDVSAKETIYFGNIIMLPPDVPKLPMELIISFFFVSVALAFMGFGQILGRTMEQFQPIRSYAVNILGSIAGILAFLAIALLEVPAPAWFLIFFLGILLFLRRHKIGHFVVHIIVLSFALGLVYFVDTSPVKELKILWSPYYRIVRWQSEIVVNGVGHQSMQSTSHPGGRFYSMPYLLHNASNGPELNNALIIGAGSGNDVAHALLNGVKRIDAVEIDPVIQRIGALEHPQRPYSDDRVSVFIDDGRSFLRKTDKEYDIIVYALVDSLTLLSTFSSVRLETFLFTREALADARGRLSENGIFVMYNHYRESWLMLRLYKMLEDAFGQKPIVLTDPPTDTIREGQNPSGSFCIFIAGNTNAIRSNFKKHGAYKIYKGDVSRSIGLNGFTFEPEPGRDTLSYQRPELATFHTEIPTDDWPHLYLRHKTIPLHNIKGLAIILILAFLLIRAAGAGGGGRINLHFFFLGSAFMVLETESITKLALLYGSTWLVNSVVFLSVLLMVFFANVYVLKFPVRRVGLVYAALFVSIAMNYFIPLDVFLGGAPVTEYGLSSLLVFLPIAFAGVIFSSTFRSSRNTSADFGSNLLGIIVGGVCEYVSLATGFSNLLIIVAAMYALSMIFLPRTRNVQ
ncbi:MAG: hypothetical protein ABIH66_00790 [bacterium]